MSNPLLNLEPFPNFKLIKLSHITPAVQKLLHDNREKLTQLLAQAKPFTWNKLMQPLEEMHAKFHTMWAVVEHLNSVKNSAELRTIHQQNQQEVAKYFAELSQNRELYKAINSLRRGTTFKKLTPAQRKVITNELRDFKLSGVALPPAQSKHYIVLQLKLSELTTKFANNVLDATQGWVKKTKDSKQLAGLPQHVITAAKAAAKARNYSGWVLSLEEPAYLAVMTYADSRKLRQELYRAYVTRASEEGPTAGKWDNSKVMETILQSRLQKARLLNFRTFADYSLATKMANKPQQVLDFLNKLATASRPKAEQEYRELEQFARTKHKITEIKPWDIAYLSEKLRQEKYNISQEELRAYFPESQVLFGLYKLLNKLYGLKIKRLPAVTTWHRDVKVFSVNTKTGKPLGYFYLDLYARSNKRGGAWMSDSRNRRKLHNGKLELPIAYITCNFTAPTRGKQALFTHSEVITLFHEFGHALQHLLTKVAYSDVAGISGIPWDAVEIASQFMEYWCWQEPVIKLISRHHKTGKPLPTKLLTKMVAAKNFQAGLQMLRQLLFALFDFRLHREFSPRKHQQILSILNQVQTQISVTPTVEFNRFPHSFLHIFSGGYAAGYYSYKWAEVLAADLFGRFLEDGIFNPKVSQDFCKTFLESGGVIEPGKLFKQFRGRAPRISTLLQLDGIKS